MIFSKMFVAAAVAVVMTAAVGAHYASATLSFASIGDWGCVPIGGWHEQDQLIIAQQFARAAEEIDAQFVLNTGDNFYYCGIEAKDSEWWNTTYENVYSQQSMMVPWFNTLGNHDYGYPTSVASQINYRSPNNNRWILPARYYYRRIQFPGKVNISLVVLDSSPCQKDYRSSDPSGWDPCGSVIPGCPGCTFHQNVIAQSCQTQRAWLQSIIPTIPVGDWKIVMNHAPAGDINVDDLISDLQNGNFDMYINGHVHLMAHYQVDGKGTYITTGGGCMVRVPDSGNHSAVKSHEAKHGKKSAAQQRKIEEAQGEVLQKLRSNVIRADVGATSCPRDNPWHSCSLVYQKTVAGYSTHTFSADFQTLYTYIYDWSGALLHSLSTKKGTGGGSGSGSGSAPTGPPSPTSSSSSSGGSNGGCCMHDDVTYCPKGQVCCSNEGNPYDKYDCDKYGGRHDCIWDAVDQKCIVN